MSVDARDVLIDVTRLVHRLRRGRLPTGVDRVSMAYVAHFGPRARAVCRWAGRSWVLSAGASRDLFLELLSPRLVSRRGLRRLLLRGVLQGLLEQADVRGCFLFNTGHSGLERASYGKTLCAMGVRPVFVVHDLIPLTHPEFCRSREPVRHRRRMKTALDVAAGLVANSEATRDELMRYAADVGRVLPPTAVARLAPGMRLPKLSGPRPIAEPYFVMLGTMEPRKNHALMLQVWRRLVERYGEAAPRLVVIGQRGWECDHVVRVLERCGSLRGVVLERTRCDDATLAVWLEHAQALLFPSFVEGYGLPLVEALAHGVPVLASALPVFREIAGDVPEYIDPLDGLGWQAAIEAYACVDSPQRAAQLERLGGFAVPTWAEHFARVDALLEWLDAHPAA